MTQYDLGSSLHTHGKLATKIRQHLVRTFGELASVYSTVARSVRQSSWAFREEDARDLSERSPNQPINARIRHVLDEGPGVSIRQLANETEIPASTVWYLLTTRTVYVC
jgi:hypothetical protein